MRRWPTAASSRTSAREDGGPQEGYTRNLFPNAGGNADETKREAEAIAVAPKGSGRVLRLPLEAAGPLAMW